MKQIVSYELKKLFRNRLILFMLMLFSILNICHIFTDYQKYAAKEESYRSGYFAVYDAVSGPWDNDKIRYVIREYEKAKAVVDSGNYSTEPDQAGTHTGYVFGDYGLFEQIRNDMEKLWHYDSRMAALTEKAADNVAFYDQKGNRQQAKLNQKIAETYQNRKVTAFYDTWGLERYLKYDFSTLLILLLLIPMLSPLFSREHETGMHGLLQLTQNYRKLASAKMLAGITASVLVSLLFITEDFLAFRYLYHIRGLSQPVYTLPDFYDSPLSVSIRSYILINAALKTLCILVIGSICTAVSAAGKKEIIPFCAASAAALILLLTDAFLENPVLSVINPVTLFSCGKLFQDFQAVFVFGTPVYAFWLPVASAALEWFLFAAMTVSAGRIRAHQR